MDGLKNFKIAFMDADGALIQSMPIPADTLTSAAQRAEEVASEIGAADFFITSKPRVPTANVEPEGVTR